MTAPTNAEQLTLELINRFRADPDGSYARLVGVQANIDGAMNFFGVNLGALQTALTALTPAAPLAWNNSLANAADNHSQAMIAADMQSHRLPGEPALRDRVEAAGYTGWNRLGENVYAFADDPLHAHAGFVIDWGYDAEDWNGNVLHPDWKIRGDGVQDPPGHRNSLISTDFTEIGLSIIPEGDPVTNVGPLVTTQNFGNRFAYQAQFVGVVINDNDNDSLYDVGEGLGGVSVSLVGTPGTFSTTTWASGGWQIAVPAGTYNITFSGGPMTGTVTKTATLGGNNVKIDAIDPGVASSPPVAVVADQTVAPGAWVQLSTVMTVTDANGDTPTWYQIWDSTGGNNWWVAGQGHVDASAGYWVAANDLAGTWLRGDASASTQTLYIQAFDTAAGPWDSFVLTTAAPAPQPPIATVQDQMVSAGGWAQLAQILTVTDVNGDTPTWYQLWDSTGGDNWWVAGQGHVDASAGYWVAANDLAGTWLQGDATASTQTLWVQAFDTTAGPWDDFVLTTA